MSDFDQTPFRTRFEWGRRGLCELGPASDVVVIVDVLSFSTAVDVALSRGAGVYPYRYGDPSAESFARREKAYLAVSRSKTTPTYRYSMSPKSLAGLNKNDRVVLPTPNGATLSLIAAEFCDHVFAGCLRNATAVAEKARACGSTIAVIAAGELWTRDGPMRAAIEDQIGAGAILAELPPEHLSPEAQLAAAAFRAVQGRLSPLLIESSSGRQLTACGCQEDVVMAAALNVSNTAPKLSGAMFVHSP